MNTQELVSKMEELLEVVKNENSKTAKAALDALVKLLAN
jgi:hypothetical protein